MARVGTGALGGRPALDLVALCGGAASVAAGCAAALLQVVLVNVSCPFTPAHQQVMFTCVGSGIVMVPRDVDTV